MKRVLLTLVAFAVAGFLAGCGNGSSNQSSKTTTTESGSATSSGSASTTTPPAADTTKAAGTASVVETVDGVTVVHLTGNDQMQYNVKEFTVPAGAKVRIVLHHIGKSPVAIMGHNVVILKQGEDYTKFDAEIVPSGGKVENGYLPESMRSRTIAYTKLVGGGETAEVEFTAPPAGVYTYLCTFPGHFALMNGKMTVQ